MAKKKKRARARNPEPRTSAAKTTLSDDATEELERIEERNAKMKLPSLQEATIET